MKIQVYDDQVAKPVQEAVLDPGVNTAAGIAAVGAGIANAASTVGNILQETQRRSEHDAAVNGASKDVDLYFEELRRNPIVPERGDIRAGKPVDVMTLRAEAWEAKKKEIEETHFGEISHARARDDVNQWWTQASETIRADVSNAAITESLQYHGKLRQGMINEHIQEQNWDEAMADVEYGLQNGFWDRSGAEDLYTAIESQQRWMVNEDIVYGAFDAAGGSYDGLDAAYTAINNSSLTEAEKKEMETQVEDYENDQYRVQKRRESDDLGGAASELHKGIMEGEVTKAMILADERLDYAWDGGKTRDWLIREYDGTQRAGAGAGGEDWALVPNSLKNLWIDRYTTDKKWHEAINRAYGAGDIQIDTKTFLEKLNREGIMETNVDEQFSSVESFWDGLIRDAETPEEIARLEGLKVEIMDNLHNSVFNNRSEMTDERVREVVRKSMVTYFAEELEMKRAGGVQNFLDPVLLDDHERILQAWQNGEYNDTQGLGFVRDTMRQVELISTDILESYGITGVTPVPYKNGLEFEGTDPNGEPGYFRLYVKDGSREDVLQQGYKNQKGEIVWLDSEFAQASPRSPGEPLPPGLPAEATAPQSFEEATAQAEQKNQWANEWREFNAAHGLGADPTRINRQAETGPPPEGWRESLDVGGYPEEYTIFPESEARRMAQERGTLGQFDRQWREAKTQVGRDIIERRENGLLLDLKVTWPWFRGKMRTKYYVSEALAQEIYNEIMGSDVGE